MRHPSRSKVSHIYAIEINGGDAKVCLRFNDKASYIADNDLIIVTPKIIRYVWKDFYTNPRLPNE